MAAMLQTGALWNTKRDEDYATLDPHALHLRASTGIGSRHSGQVLEGGPGVGLINALVTR